MIMFGEINKYATELLLFFYFLYLYVCVYVYVYINKH